MQDRAAAATHPPPEMRTAPVGAGAAAEIAKAAKPSRARYPAEVKAARLLRAGRALGHAIFLADRESVAAAASLWAECPRFERALAAGVILSSLEPDDAIATAEVASGRAGHPLPPLFSAFDEAVWWASIASEPEIEAFCLAAFLAMRPPRQDAFLEYVQRRRAA